jgi:hypothetical protein
MVIKVTRNSTHAQDPLISVIIPDPTSSCLSDNVKRVHQQNIAPAKRLKVTSCFIQRNHLFGRRFNLF